MKNFINRNRYQVIMGLVILITLVLGFSYALFSSSVVKNDALTIIAGDFSYKITGEGVDPSGIYTIAPNTNKEYTLTIENLSNKESKYQMYYKVLEGEDPAREEVMFLEETKYPVVGTIKEKETITIKIILENRLETNLKVLVGIQGGLVESTITLKEGIAITKQKSLPMLVRGTEQWDESGSWCMLADYFWNYKTDITKVVFNTEKTPPINYDPYLMWDLSIEKNGEIMGYLTGKKDTGYTLYIQSWDKVYANIDSSFYFYVFGRLASIEGLGNLDTSKVTNMSNMFSSCMVTELDVSKFDTSNVTNMEFMFGSTPLTNMDLSNFDTSKVTNMKGMFNQCWSLLNLNLSSFDTSNVTDMSYMFRNTRITSLDLSNFNTSSVTNMTYMFGNSMKLASLNLSSFNTLNVTNMAYMFYDCSYLTSLNLLNSSFNNVVTFENIFGRLYFSTIITVKDIDAQAWVISKNSSFSTSNVIIG